MTGDQLQVRVRTRARDCTFYSAAMARADALNLAEQVAGDVYGCGGGHGLFAFATAAGLPARIRGRDVVAVDLVRPPSSHHTPAVPASVVPVVNVTGGPISGAVTSGTDFLRAVAGTRPAHHSRTPSGDPS